jgi:hypothetical protein
MMNFLLVAAFIGQISASPVSLQAPPRSQSTAFNFIVNVTDLSTDLSPSVHHTYFTSVHAGAGFNAITLGTTKYPGKLFLNGTDDEIKAGNGSIISDTGNYPFTIRVNPNAKLPYGDALESWMIASGPQGVGITAPPDPIAKLYGPIPGRNFIACDSGFGAPTHPQIVILYVEPGPENIPTNCTAINILAECRPPLEPLTADAKYTHDYAHPVQCYEDVLSIDWSKY